jgi:hypothetical protein
MIFPRMGPDNPERETQLVWGAHAPSRAAEDALVLGSEARYHGTRHDFRRGRRKSHARARVLPGNRCREFVAGIPSALSDRNSQHVR